MCWEKDSVLSSHTAKYLYEVTTSSSKPSEVVITPVGREAFFLPNHMIFVLEVFRTTLRAEKACWDTPGRGQLSIRLYHLHINEWESFLLPELCCWCKLRRAWGLGSSLGVHPWWQAVAETTDVRLDYSLVIAALSEPEAQASHYTRINICLPCVCDKSNLIWFKRKSAVSSYNSHLQHEQCLHCISDQFDVILMDKKNCFSLKNMDISKWPQTFER
jgi:hypothetical protein